MMCGLCYASNTLAVDFFDEPPKEVIEMQDRCPIDLKDENLCSRASQGDINAQSSVGMIYYDAKYYEYAVKWLKLSASSGETEAANHLGWMYHNGKGVNVDEVESFKWYNSAAQSAHPLALYNIGLSYVYGRGVKRDINQGLLALRMAADKGVPEACYDLGRIYEEGSIVEKNMEKASYFYKKAADKDYVNAQYRLATLIANGYIEFDSEKDSQEQAITLYTLAANRGYAMAQYDLGNYLITKNKNYKEAVKRYRQASIQGVVAAQEKLGTILLNGNEQIKQNYTEAYKWLREAAEGNSAYAEYGLGRIYELGLEVNYDLTKAISHYKRSVQLGGVQALLNLGFIYEQKGMIDKDEDKLKSSFEYYKKAANLGHKDAKYHVGRMLFRGIGVPTNVKSAINYLQSAISSGSVFAKYELSLLYFKKSNMNSKAKRLLKEAAEAGYVLAQEELAQRYADGNGFEKNLVKSYAWISVAAECKGFLAFKKSKFFNALTKEQQNDAEVLYREYHTNFACKYY